MVGIPADVVRRFNIQPGDEVEVRESGDEIVIQPKRNLASLFAEWNDTLDDATMDEIVAAIREDRDAH
jgi:AbrB family looped-hinge helix DNA binding protein